MTQPSWGTTQDAWLWAAHCHLITARETSSPLHCGYLTAQFSQRTTSLAKLTSYGWNDRTVSNVRQRTTRKEKMFERKGWYMMRQYVNFNPRPFMDARCSFIQGGAFRIFAKFRPLIILSIRRETPSKVLLRATSKGELTSKRQPLGSKF